MLLPLRDRLPTRAIPFVNYLLLAANIVAFLGERALLEVGVHPHRLLMTWGLVPARLVSDPVGSGVTVFTSMFMHDPSGWLHLGYNMLFLWIFGDNVEDALGSLRYLAFYILSGIAAAAGQVLIDPTSTVPMVGASGAIAGVLAAYGSLYPRSPITIAHAIWPLWFVFGLFPEVPAWIVILLFFVTNLVSGLASLGGRTGGIAFFAHLGGFVAGLFLIRLFMVGRLRRDYDRWSGWRSRSRRASPFSGEVRRRGSWDS
jgi:membrane associated rhomboid family serine protease